MIRAAILCLMAAPLAADPLFEDMSSALPPHVYDGDWTHFVGGGLAVMDCNGDTLPDIFAAGGSTPAILIVNQGGFSFEQAPLVELTGVTGAYPINLDGDEHTDLYVLRAGSNVALRGGPECSFSDATADWGLPQDDRWSTAFTAWWEGDRPTLAIGNYVDRDDPMGPFEACDDNVLLTPSSDGYDATLLTPGFCPLSMLAARDARGKPALRLSNDRHYYVKDGYEQMWDITERRFLGPEDGWQPVSLWGMGIASRDLDGDGLDEVMLTSMGDQLLQLAQPDGTYQAAPYEIGSYAQRPHIGDEGRPSTGWHAEFGDVDNDGRADLFIAKGNVDQMPGMATRDPNNLLMQTEGGTFVEHAADAGVASMDRSRGAALVDFDGDGRLDLLVSNRRAPLELYRNTTQQTGNWLGISLRQSGGNRDAIGAVIRIGTQSQQNTIGGGHAGGQLGPRHFGLGDRQTARIDVTWPDGSTSSHVAEANQTVVLQKP
ncbi:CRTAC1 family protein [Pseudooctadecabacter sp.]|uniref:CRTAC1 family protein n=1 Tax=Pseudooctadecabacter sp. TaxID=1966338 RepID=UPI0025FDF2E1|nr:CRTAC1 family protein [Pseudooctadecabacter sp.]